MAAIIPVIIGGRVLQLAAPRALALIEAGVARYLPAMRTVGSQGAGSSAAGPFYRAGASNVPAAIDRPGLVGKGIAGGLAAGSAALGGPGSSVIPQGLFGELDERGARAEAPPPASAPAPMPAPVRSMDSTLYGEDVGPRPALIRVSDSTLAGYDMPSEKAARNAVRVAQSVMPRDPAAAPQPAPGPSARELFSRYNESESPADFIIASNALLRERPDMTERYGRAEGGGIPEGMMGARPMPMPHLDLPPMDGPAPMGDMPPFGAMGPAPNKPAGGTGAGGRDAAINKALEIIHHLVIRGR